MSTRTLITVRPRYQPKYTVEFQGQRGIPIESVLGAGGMQWLQRTLAQIDVLRATVSPEMAAMLDWEPAAGKRDAYVTQVRGVSVELRLEGSQAQVVYAGSAQFTGQRPRDLTQEHLAAVTGKVNQLLAFTMAQRVSTHLAARVREKVSVQQMQSVRVGAQQSLALRVSARLGVRA